VLHLRQIIGPQREVLARFARSEFKLVRAHLVPVLPRRLRRLFTIGERAQAYADSLTNVLQVYVNMSSHQTGEVIKLLTLITIVTTPLTLIGTWYGMNFDTMPEVRHPHGYIYVIVLTLVTTAATFYYFKRKGWL
jgi:magnesium transporter